MGRTIIEKIWDNHIIYEFDGWHGLYVDLHFIHEVTSPQAFEGLELANRKVRRPDLTVATVDHNVPTTPNHSPITDHIAEKQIKSLYKNTEKWGILFFDINSPYQGIVHVIGPELGITQPGMVIVCGDSHTSTHGALGAMAFGIGTSEVELVLSTQTIKLKKPKTMEVRFEGKLSKGVYSKDVILALIGKIGVGGANGYAVEYTGNFITDLSIEGRLTICNMSIEAGARVGIISPDEKTFEYLEGKPFAPKGKEWEKALSYWETLKSDPQAKYDKVVTMNVSNLEPMVTWGTNPSQVQPITGRIPYLHEIEDEFLRNSAKKALNYMGLEEGIKITDIPINVVFIGSCTNARIEDLREAAKVIKGKKVHPKVRAMVVPGSTQVKLQAEKEGLDKIFKDSGFEWRESGCSMCLGMNPDVLAPGQRCASTSNRNFENRQGKGGRTHLVSPAMAAAAAIAGKFIDVREIL
ncbi:MAG: 3-isopropylmalate dehydratase large subunit [Candidatus Calescibacterium sp.]|nr:3-isopropylmalate dehydratase large subunit [Candidatus Calescibacterium sp.]